MGRKTKADCERERASKEQAIRPDTPYTPFCFKCGRILKPSEKIYTVRFRGRCVDLSCPVCAASQSVRVRVPYLSVEAVRQLRMPEEWKEDALWSQSS